MVHTKYMPANGILIHKIKVSRLQLCESSGMCIGNKYKSHQNNVFWFSHSA